MRKFTTTLLLLLSFGLPAYAQNIDDHIRYREGRTTADGELQIAVTEYRNSEGRAVTLYGVVHIADDAYYREVQRDLDRFDAVLYEGVGPQPGQERPQQPPPGAIDLSLIQRLFADGLGFQFQKDGINYTRENLVHADMSMEELQEALGGKSISPLEQYVPRQEGGEGFDLRNITPLLEEAGQFLQRLADSSPEIRRILTQLQDRLKLQMAQQLVNADLSTMMDPNVYRVIVTERNKIVIETLRMHLRQNPDHSNIAIFYGAAHMPDLEQRLERLGFAETSKRWMGAWRIGNGALRETLEEDGESDRILPRRREPARPR